MATRIWIRRKLALLAGALGASLLHSLLLALPSSSAEQVYINYGMLERSISVDVLETYAETGEVEDALEVYRRYLTPEQMAQLRTGLTTSIDLDVVAVAQFLYTPQGEAILAWLGEVIQTAGRQNGALAIRGAVIQAAADPDGGLNVLNVLKYFPTSGIRLDLQQLLGISQIAIAEINQTSQLTEQIQTQAAAAAADPANLNPALAVAGSARWTIQSIDSATLPTDLYLPENQNAPVVVISHGIGGNRATLAYLGQHLASHGFAAVVVEHPGSSENQFSALMSGRASDAIEPDELIHRPTSIQVLLDELEAAAQRDPGLRNRIDLQRVGVLGQSLGAYTSLALAGATVDLARLEASCPPEIAQLNLSLLLQCSVLTMPQPLPTLQDNRVQAVFAINPLDSAIFGPEGMANIEVPLMMVSGSADTVTPALAEQIRPFAWLTTPERYLLMMENGTHFSTIYDPEAAAGVLSFPDQAIGPSPELAQRYVREMSLAFFKTYLAGEDTYRQYLDPAYAAAISQPEMPLALIRELSLESDVNQP